jgi:CheY-like chemotaxis protein
MSEETQRLIFDPFFTTKQPDKGTGLGLAIVYGIVQQSGGWIELNSAPGAGATFTVYLPLSAQPAGTAELESEPVRGGTETILAVDDQPGVLELVGEILRSYGYTVLLAPGPEEAIASFRNSSEAIALLLSDIVMPGMSGLELAAVLRAERPGLRTMFMSAYSDDLQAKRRVIEAGTRLLSKPLQAEVLASAVRSVLDELAPEIRTDTLLQTA